MHTTRAETIIEELEIDLGEGYSIYSAELDCTIEGVEGEARTYDYPGSPSTVEFINLEVGKIVLFNENADDFITPDPDSWAVESLKQMVLKYLEQINWKEDNEEWAREVLSDYVADDGY